MPTGKSHCGGPAATLLRAGGGIWDVMGDDGKRGAFAAELRAAFGPAFPHLRKACNLYRRAELQPADFCASFYRLTAADDSLAVRADVLLELVTQLLPAPRRAALRDPGLRGRARVAAATQQPEPHAYSSALVVTLKSLRHGDRAIDLPRSSTFAEVKQQILNDPTLELSPGTGVRLLVAGQLLPDEETVGSCAALAASGGGRPAIHMLIAAAKAVSC